MIVSFVSVKEATGFYTTHGRITRLEQNIAEQNIAFTEPTSGRKPFQAGAAPGSLSLSLMNFALSPLPFGSNRRSLTAPRNRIMPASLAVADQPRFAAISASAMELPPESIIPPNPEPPGNDDTQRAIRDLLDVLPQDILDELNSGAINLEDAAFLDGLMDHVSRLSLASPRSGQRILSKIIKLKKLISRSLRESDPEIAVNATVTRTGQRLGRNDRCSCGSGRKYKQCCLRKA
jgi:SEC-C motif